MKLKTKFFDTSYKYLLKPLLFSFDPETVHDGFAKFSYFSGTHTWTKNLTKQAFNYLSPSLQQNLLGINFTNPIGLSAGFDYDGWFAGLMSEVGFGFHTVGTVTAKYYEGNTKPRLMRMPSSQALLVNKGFKSGGIDEVLVRLDKFRYDSSDVTGISIGSTNIPQIDTIPKAINDYVTTFRKVDELDYVKYLELNISCPNITMKSKFTDEKNLKMLLDEINQLKISKPIFLKMPAEMPILDSLKLSELAIKQGIKGLIFSNLIKNRDNPQITNIDRKKIAGFSGNISGKPVFAPSNTLIKSAYKHFGKAVIIVGCGGVFDGNDAFSKISSGASLVQLITGMIYGGPSSIGKINQELSAILKQKGFKNVSEAVGSNV